MQITVEKNRQANWTARTMAARSGSHGLAMSPLAAVAALSALAHVHRLAVFRLLVRVGASGLPAGEIARRIDLLPSTLTSHLMILGHAGLVKSRRHGRFVIYTADPDGMRSLLAFVVADSCDGRLDICGALADLVADD